MLKITPETKVDATNISSITRREFFQLVISLLPLLLTSCDIPSSNQEIQTENCPEWADLEGQCEIRTEKKSVNGMVQITVKEGEQCLITVYSPSLVISDEKDHPRIQRVGQFVTNKTVTLVSQDPETSLTQYKAEWVKNLLD
jgi:hypothetical protein